MNMSTKKIGRDCVIIFLSVIICLTIIVEALFLSLSGEKLVPYKERYGYINVRRGANMFWWLYYQENYSELNSSRPLFIWMQGGPGDSSCGYGNFREIGPLDADLKRRQSTWLAKADLLFIDSPVGSGYSYVDSNKYLTKNMQEIVWDLIKMMSIWFSTHPIYKERPIFIFGESFGGRVAVELGWQLYQKINIKNDYSFPKINLKGVALGNAWISPEDFVLSWPDFLYFHSFFSSNDLIESKNQSEQCAEYFRQNQWRNASACLEAIYNLINKLFKSLIVISFTGGVNFYNIMKLDNLDAFSTNTPDYLKLKKLMNGPIRKKLADILPDTLQWAAQIEPVYAALLEEIMKSAVKTVDQLLLKTDLKIIIYNGQLDFLCNTHGVEMWTKKLTWPNLGKFFSAERKPFSAGHIDFHKNNNPIGFVRRYENLCFFWMLNAGHTVPEDAPKASLRMIELILEYYLHD